MTKFVPAIHLAKIRKLMTARTFLQDYPRRKIETIFTNI